MCPALGTVFLDEIGDLDRAIQVELLRVLQTRTFSRLGETQTRNFHGKIVTATNRDVFEEMRAGQFREDFYYRLCSDMITTPSLHDQLIDCPDDLPNLVWFIARQVTTEEAEALANEVVAWIDNHLGRDYPWTGNFRELEQCVRNVMIRKAYHPPRPSRPPDDHPPDSDDPRNALAHDVRNGTLSADELLRQYCTLVYAQTGSYEEAARRLNLDRRTIKSRIDDKLLQRLTRSVSEGGN